MATNGVSTRPTMHLGVFDWLLAGTTVALGIVLVAAPFALTPGLRSLYAIHDVLEARSTLSRLMMTAWLPPMMAVIPSVISVYCTVTYMTPRRRRAALVLSLLAALLTASLFVYGLVSPIMRVASGS